MTIHPFPHHSGSSEPRAVLPWPLTAQPFPEDAHAVIYRPARSATTSGTAGTREWKLRFERRTPPFIEPLMGWTGGDDTLTQVELSFPSAESAIAYARRQGLQYTVHGMPQHKPELRMSSGTTEADRAASRERRLRLEWVERTLGPAVIRQGFGPGTDPAVRYADPQDVLRDPDLASAEKRELLHRWALDAYLLDLAYSMGEPQSEKSRLQEVIDALINLDQPTSERAREQMDHERNAA